jgi:ABC-type nitrate/sulfonate/bicarbonate transport system permease component
VFAALVWLAALGVALFGAVAGLERLLLPWHHTERRRMQWER